MEATLVLDNLHSMVKIISMEGRYIPQKEVTEDPTGLGRMKELRVYHPYMTQDLSLGQVLGSCTATAISLQIMAVHQTRAWISFVSYNT